MSFTVLFTANSSCDTLKSSVQQLCRTKIQQAYNAMWQKNNRRRKKTNSVLKCHRCCLK